MRYVALTACALLWTAVAFAADEPIYGPPADWVRESSLPEDPTPADESPLAILLWDQQVHVDAMAPHTYTRMAVRINTPQGLMGLNTLSTLWSPQFQTLTIHQVAIHRGEETIDVLRRGQRFTVLRRESNLEYAMLDGVLTATLQPEGLRVGDTVSFAFTVTGADPALKGMVQGALIAPQLQAKNVRLRASWGQGVELRWQATGAFSAAARQTRNRRGTAVEIALDGLEPRFPPTNAPTRYQIPPLLELSSYTSWRQVSSQMAGLFERAVQIAPDSSVQAEIDRIRSAYDTPLERASAALRMVQDEVRYLYVALDDGGLVPASAEETWARRFGDCKGKTALLLALLRGLGVEASPVLVNSIAGDAIPDRLPMVGAFDHVIVRTEIEGNTYWLDGARTGDRAIDRIVTPLFHWGLPILPEGADLVEIRPAPLEAPSTRIVINLDFSGGLTVPGKVEGTVVLSGDAATQIQQTVATLTASQADQMLRAIWGQYYPSAEIGAVAGSLDQISSEYTVTMAGTVRSLWSGWQYRSVLGDMIFPRDVIPRPEHEDQEVPYAIQFPHYVSVRETLTLPLDGSAFRIEGAEIDMSVAGFEMRRSVHVDGQTVTVAGSSRSLKSELPASEMPDASRRLAALAARPLYVVAPAGYRAPAYEQQAELGPAPLTAGDYVNRGIVHLDSGRYDRAIEDFTSALNLAPGDAYALANRGIAHAWRMDAETARRDLEAAEAIDSRNPVVFRGYGLLARQRSNHYESIEHFTRAIEVDPDNVFSYNMRSQSRLVTSDFEGALEDSRAATRLDQTIAHPYVVRATVYAMRGLAEQATAEFDTMMATTIVDAPSARMAARHFAMLRQPQKAIDALNRAIEAQPTPEDFRMRAALRENSDVAGRLADHEAALELNPDSRESRLGLASARIEADQAEQAIPLLNELIQLDSRDIVALGERGIAYLLAGDDDLADADFKSARATANSAVLLNALCWRKATLNLALEAAIADCLRALEFEVAAPFHDSLGFAYLRLGRYEDAIRSYDSALDLRPNLPHSLFGRALAKREIGDGDGYEQDMRDAVRGQPAIADEFARYGVIP